MGITAQGLVTLETNCFGLLAFTFEFYGKVKENMQQEEFMILFI